jgi:hypothetical protein
MKDTKKILNIQFGEVNQNNVSEKLFKFMLNSPVEMEGTCNCNCNCNCSSNCNCNCNC